MKRPVICRLDAPIARIIHIIAENVVLRTRDLEGLRQHYPDVVLHAIRLRPRAFIQIEPISYEQIRNVVL